MSSIVQDELSQLTNEQLRMRLLEHGMANVPITSTTREVLLKKLRSKINAQQSTNRRETIHVTKVEVNEEKTDSKSKKAGNRRNTVNAIPTITNDVAPVPKSTNVRRSGRVTPLVNENGTAAPIVINEDILEVDEDPVREVYIQPKRTSRSPSLGKSQTVVTSYKTEAAKPIPIVESNEEDDDDDAEFEDDENDDENVDVIPISQNRLYPSLGIDNGLKKGYASSSKDITSNLRRTTMYTTNYEPTSYKPTLRDQNYDEVTSFKAPLSKRPITTSYRSYGDNISGPNRRYTSSTYGSTHAAQNYEDESGTEQSDIETPYLSDFARRLTQLKAEPLNRKILQDVKQHHRYADDSLWHSFTMLVIAFGRKFGSILLAFIVLMILVFVYVFFIMG